MALVSVDSINSGGRLRSINETQVDSLVASIADVGLLNPITVYEKDGGYGLIAGAHRLEAVKRLGLTDIDVHVVTLSEYERQIAECDENLCSSVLTKTERAMFTARRKEAYEALHPETVHGVNQHSSSRQVGDSTADRFTADTAAKTGQSERVVQRDAERGMKISDKALAVLRGTTLDTGSYLDQIKDIPQSEQVARIKADLETEKARLKRVGLNRRAAAGRRKISADALSGDDVVENQYAALVSAWNKAGDVARARFRELIDSPVFDRSAA